MSATDEPQPNPSQDFWPPEIFGSDTAQMVRQAYLNGGGEAVFEEFAPLLADPIEAPVVVLTLANAQWADGRLSAELAAASLEVLDDEIRRRPTAGTDSMLWQQRRETLRALRERFGGEPE